MHRLLTYFIALVWLINGLYCKVLDGVHRHEQIVGRILSETYSRELIVTIGLLEIGMMIWVLSGIKTKLNAISQILLVVTMNILEFILVPDLLLWGRVNAIFAAFFVVLVYYNEFSLRKKFAT